METLGEMYMLRLPEFTSRFYHLSHDCKNKRGLLSDLKPGCEDLMFWRLVYFLALLKHSQVGTIPDVSDMAANSQRL